jgi:hypothetical protein
MTKKIAKMLPVALVLALVGFMPTRAVASGSVPASVTGGGKARVNNAVSNGFPLSKEARAVKQFGADGTATLVSDEGAVVPTTGGLASMEIADKDGNGTAACYLMVFDSSVAADTTEAGSVSRMLVPPLVAVTSGNANREFAYPKQFHKGLVVLVGGPDPTQCRATIGWVGNGGSK